MISSFVLSDIASYCSAELLGRDAYIKAVSTDTRSIEPGDLFVALKGENFDGHEYLHQAIGKGAVALLVDAHSGYITDIESKIDTDKVGIVKVADTLKALGDIGALNRSRFNGPVIGITGSAGKTTTKEMIAAILNEKGQALYTQSNFNNEIGVPRTLLSITEKDQFAVIEMGAARVGDIEYLGQFVKPDISVLTNAAEVHIEGFENIDGVAKGKSEIYRALSSSGIGILNVDDDFAPLWKSIIDNVGAKAVNVSLDKTDAYIYASDIDIKPVGSAFLVHIKDQTQQITLPVAGIYNVKNALMAIAVANELNIDLPTIAHALSHFSGTAGRMQLKQFGNLTILDDTYNANPKAMKAALDVLSNQKTYKISVLGGMGELGRQSGSLHEDVLQYTQECEIDSVYCFGDTWPRHQKFGNTKSFNKKDELGKMLTAEIQSLLAQNKMVTVLIKGSRSMKMEEVAQLLMSTYDKEKVGAN